MRKLTLLLSVFLFSVASFSQQSFVFTAKKEMPCTSVKDQNATNTCWCFSGLSMLESEMIRIGKKPVDLSVMFIVNHTYTKKADMFARMHGSSTLAGGGEYGDVLSALREVGAMPASAYSGLNYGSASHNHTELDGVVKGYMDALIKSQNLTTAWKSGLKGILDSYLGSVPSSFMYDGKSLTPVSFLKETGLNPDDYLVLTSFTHHPYYSQFMLEVPDNWAAGMFYNLPLDELMQVIDNSLSNGYTVAWSSDMSDRGFSMREGVAIVPEKNWNDMSSDELSKAFSGPRPEKVITPELRQSHFDNYQTTDDHGMHMTGLFTDQTGSTFYKVKNSWGITGKYDGFIYVSKAYVRLRTTNIMVNKAAVPVSIAVKLGLNK